MNILYCLQLALVTRKQFLITSNLWCRVDMMIVNNWQRLVNISSISCSAVTESLSQWAVMATEPEANWTWSLLPSGQLLCAVAAPVLLTLTLQRALKYVYPSITYTNIVTGTLKVKSKVWGGFYTVSVKVRWEQWCRWNCDLRVIKSCAHIYMHTASLWGVAVKWLVATE